MYSNSKYITPRECPTCSAAKDQTCCGVSGLHSGRRRRGKLNEGQCARDWNMETGDNRLENSKQRVRREDTAKEGEIQKLYRRKLQVWDWELVTEGNVRKGKRNSCGREIPVEEKRWGYCDRLATHTWTECFGNAKKNERVQRGADLEKGEERDPETETRNYCKIERQTGQAADTGIETET